MDRNAAKAELDAAIAEAWRVFDLPRPATTGVCTACCMDADIADDFLNHDARDLPAQYLYSWQNAAYSDDLGYQHVGWLLPRFMEAMASDDDEIFLSFEEDWFLGHLARAGYPDRWPERAVATVERFADALFDFRLAGPIHWGELDATICGFFLAGLPVGRFTTRLEILPDPVLASALHGNWDIVRRCTTIPVSPAWQDPGRTHWWNWQTSEALLDRMTRAGLAGDDRAAAVSDVILRALHG